MNDKKQSEYLEKYILDLYDNEHALPESELDDDLADFTRLLVTQRKENEMAKERVWTTVTASGKSTPNFQRWLVFAAAILSVAFIGGLLLLPDEKHQFGQSLDTTPTINENAIAQTDFAMATSTSTFTSTVAPTQTVTTTSTSTWTPSSTVTSTSTPPATRLIADTDRPLIVTATVSDPAATATAIILTFEASQGTFQPSSPTFKTPLLIIDEELPLSLTLNIERIDFVNQTWNNGGPAALSMLLSYYDVDISQLEIASALRPNAEDKNTTFAEIEAYMRSADFANFMSETFFSGANESVLKRAIGTGYPVLVSTGYEVDESNGWFAQYLLVVGYDTAGFQVIDPYLNTSSEPLHIPYDEFDSQWQEMNRPLMLVYPQGDSMIIQTIVGGFSDAQQASNIALQKVIEDLALNAEDGWAWFNLGDSLLAMGSSEAAVAAFDKAIELGLPSRAFWYRTSIFEAYLLGERYNDIIRLTNDVLKSTSDVEETYIYRALAYDAQGMTEKAAENAQQAYELNPGHPMLDNLKSYYGSTPSND